MRTAPPRIAPALVLLASLFATTFAPLALARQHAPKTLFADDFESGDAAHWSAADGYTALVHRLGRFDLRDPEAPRFAWPGSALRTRFRGTGIAIELEEEQSNHYQVEIDVREPSALVTHGGRAVYELASGLEAGEHDLTITRRTEGTFGVTRFHGLAGAELVATPPPARWIEVIGDSITCGYGVLGEGPRCDFSAETEAEPFAWGALAARALGAVHTTIAYSGKGVSRNVSNDHGPLMPELFHRTLPDEPGSEWGFHSQPAAVVVNLGTNDFVDGHPGPIFVDALGAFLAQIREHYPAAKIVVASSPMLRGTYRIWEVDALLVAVAVAGPGVSYLDLAPPAPDEGYGCDYHPSAATQQRMADTVADELRALLGW